jgi:ethanolamine utilization microcompartment shell protein EutS
MNIPGLNETRLVVLSQAIRELASGASNSVGQVTLTPSSTTTVVADPLATASSHIDLCPLTANAAAAQAAIYVSSRGQAAFTLTHASAASGDRTFSYRISRT